MSSDSTPGALPFFAERSVQKIKIVRATSMNNDSGSHGEGYTTGVAALTGLVKRSTATNRWRKDPLDNAYGSKRIA